MRSLLNKYKRGRLSPDELRELREGSRRLGEEELERLFLEDWLAFQKEEGVGVPIGYERMREETRRRIASVERRSWLGKLMRYAAILLVPLLLVSTLYFYKKAEVVAEQDGQALLLRARVVVAELHEAHARAALRDARRRPRVVVRRRCHTCAPLLVRPSQGAGLPW